MGLSRTIIFILLTMSVLNGAAQDYKFYFEVRFKDKNGIVESLNNPHDFLSERAIIRRQSQNIELDDKDLPINRNYIDSVLSIPEVALVTKSKWFNLMVIGMEDTTNMPKLRIQPFVESLTYISGTPDKSSSLNEKLNIDLSDGEVPPKSDYGNGLHQIQMINGLFLHERGFMGEGILIGVIDGGFSDYTKVPAYQRLIDDNRILATYDFIGRSEFIEHRGTHGTYILSTMAAYDKGNMIGTAPNAEYLLLISEDGSAEYIVEEYFWIEAAEFADSAGADILNTSLGYTTFDEESEDHEYADLNGNTTIITRASDIAASRGMLVVNSAGNSGTSDWYYIGAPADGDSVLTIGAVDSLRNYASFSSKGPAADGDVKPNVMAQGSATYFAGIEGGTFKGSGTSFSGPIIAGMAACLWQSSPNSGNMEVYKAIENSAHLIQDPSDTLGYGIPDFGLAHFLLNNELDNVESKLKVFPNPFTDHIYLLFEDYNKDLIEWELYDEVGQVVYKGRMIPDDRELQLFDIPAVGALESGTYILRLRSKDISETITLIKSE